MSDTNNTPKTLAEMLAEVAAQRAAEQKAKGGGLAIAVKSSRTTDAFGSPIGTGTHSMHVVLAAAYADGLTLTRAEIKKFADYGNADNHLNTMRGKGRAISDGRGLWRLSDAAGEHWHGQGKTFGFAKQQQQPASPPAAEDIAPPAEDIAPPAAEEQPKGKGKKGK